MKWVSRVVLATGLLVWTTAVWGSEGPADDLQADVAFVVVGTARDYGLAARVAERAAAQLGVPLDLRGLVFDPAYGLTLPADACTDPLFPYPAYLPRGRYDAGSYVSIEQSDGYEALRPGYFVVIAASGEPRSDEVEDALANARRVYRDAYVFREKVYLGCMH